MLKIYCDDGYGPERDRVFGTAKAVKIYTLPLDREKHFAEDDSEESIDALLVRIKRELEAKDTSDEQHEAPRQAGTAGEQVDREVKTLRLKNPGTSYAQALHLVLDADPALKARYAGGR